MADEAEAKTLCDRLYPFQKSILSNYRDMHRLGLFLDMGLGKTVLSLAFAEDARADNLIIVTVNSKAVETEATHGSFAWWISRSPLLSSYARYDKAMRVPDKLPSPTRNILIANYESLFNRGAGISLSPAIKRFLKGISGSCALILDESHRVKNPSSKAFKAVSKMVAVLSAIDPEGFRLLLLSGTPFTVGYIDLWAQLRLLGLDMTKGEYMDRFCVRGYVPGLLAYQQPIVGYKDLDGLYALANGYAVTVKSKEVVDLGEIAMDWHILPSPDSFRLFTSERIPPSIADARCAERGLPPCRAVRADNLAPNPFFRNLFAPDYSSVSDTSGAAYMRGREASIGFGVDSGDVCEWLDRSRLDAFKRLLSEHPGNYAVFCNFNAELIELYDICESLGYKADVWCGRIKTMAHYDAWKEGDPERNAVICNFASGSTGLNLQKYHHAVFFSLPVYRDWAQAIKRIHRIGQSHPAVCHVFMADNWLERGMRKAIGERKDYDERLFEEGMKAFGKDAGNG